jgi:hypothetical protein
MSELTDKMLAGLASLRASTARYRSHNSQLDIARAVECPECCGTGLDADRPKGICPACRGRRVR